MTATVATRPVSQPPRLTTITPWSQPAMSSYLSNVSSYTHGDSSFPDKPFFSCSPSELQVIDQADMGEMLRGGSVVPWMRFVVGEGNILESEPVKATSADGKTVQIVCGDATVEIDFFDETAHRTGSDGVSMMYMGGLDEANDGRGWISAR